MRTTLKLSITTDEIMTSNQTRVRSVRPVHPGELLREDYLPAFGISVQELADHIGVTRQTIYALIREERACSPEMALRLSRAFNTSAEFWLNAQRTVDLWDAALLLGPELQTIKRIVMPATDRSDPA